MRSDGGPYAVGDLKTGLFAQVLYAIDQLAGHSLLTKGIGKLHFKSHGDVALVADEPSGNILRDDLHVGSINNDLLTVKLKGVGAGLFKLCNLLL